MNYDVKTILVLTIIIPGIVGLIRLPRIHKSFYPFIVYIWAGIFTEIIGEIVIRMKYSNTISFNIYNFLELLILLWQFSYWIGMKRHSIFIIGLYIISSLFFLVENTVISDMNHYNSYFLIYSSCIQLIFSIHIINSLVMKERGVLWKNPVFIICTTFIMYNIVHIITECFWLYGINIGSAFKSSMQDIHLIVNFMSIILYTLAIIWMPTRYRFSTPLS